MVRLIIQDGYRVMISLRWTDPSIWRTMCIPSDLSLGEMHRLIQIVMGWEDCHLHQFKQKKRIIGVPHADDWREVIDEEEVFVDEIFPRKGSKIEYEYDFGDGWIHDVVSLGTMKNGDEIFRVLEGSGACPPEDCGGVPGFYHMQDALKDTAHPEHNEIKEWIGEDYDPDRFDLNGVNATLKKLADENPEQSRRSNAR